MKNLIQEKVVAKLAHPEKSMILRQFANHEADEALFLSTYLR